MWLLRDLSPILQKSAAQRPSVLVTGSRQTGKSSLLRHVFPKASYVSLDLPLVAAEAETNPVEFLGSFKGQVILDEIQYAPGLFRHLKPLIDQDRGRHGRWILTGSQKFSLMKGVAESLAGRITVQELAPLSAHEVRIAKLPVDDLPWRGGYPELWAQGELDAFDFYRDYTVTYLERDLRTLLNVGDLRSFERFLRACALRAGNLVNYTDLSHDAGISPVTAKSWLSTLQASGLVHLLEPWFSNHGKRMIKSPKLYFMDSGLLCFLLRIRSASDWEQSALKGALWENFVFTELWKALSLMGEDRNLYFYRDAGGLECDFLWERGALVHLIEAKASETWAPSQASSLNKLKELFKKRTVVMHAAIRRRDHRGAGKVGDVRVFNPLLASLSEE